MRGILFSILLHTLIVLAVALGLPWLAKPPANASRSITVDIVRLSDITRDSKGEKPKPKTERKPEAERETTTKPVARDRRVEKQPDEPKPVKPKPPAPEPPKTAEPKPAPQPPKTAVAEPKPEPKPVPPPKTEIVKPATVPPAQPKPAERAKAAPKPKIEPPKRVEIDPRALQRQTKKPKKKIPAKKPETRAAKPPPKPKPAKRADPPVAKTPVAKAAPKPEMKMVPPKKPETPVAKPKKKPPKPLEEPKKAEPKIEPEIAALPRMRPALKPRPKKAAKKPPKSVKKRPTKEDPLDSVFKTVGKLKKSAAESDRDRSATRSPEGVKAAARSLPMTLSEIEAVRRQIQPCWNFPAGAQDAGSLRVLIRIWLNRDGSVRDAKVLDRARIAGNSKLRAAADAGLRAVNNPRCSPLRLPPEKFDQWKVLTIDFDPSKLKSG